MNLITVLGVGESSDSIVAPSGNPALSKTDEMKPLSRSLDVEGVHIEGMTVILLYPATDVMSEIGEGRSVVPLNGYGNPRIGSVIKSQAMNITAMQHGTIILRRIGFTGLTHFPFQG